MLKDDLSEIRGKMAERSRVLKPAIAGLIVDNRVDRKEVFATFVQLVVCGHVQIVPYRKFVRIGKPKLLRFERFVLDTALPDDSPVDEKTAVKRLKEADLAEFSMLLLDELIEQGIADGKSSLTMSSRSGEVRASSEMHVGENSISRRTESTTDYVGGERKGGLLSRILGRFFSVRVKRNAYSITESGKSYEEVRKKMDERLGNEGFSRLMDGQKITGPSGKIEIQKGMSLRMGLSKDGSGLASASENKDPKIIGAFVEVARGPPDVGASASGFEFSRTPKAEMLVKEYLELKDFLERFPVHEDRFSNDFVGYNIAFHLRAADRLPS